MYKTFKNCGYVYIAPPLSYVLLHFCSFYNTFFLILWIMWSPYPQRVASRSGISGGFYSLSFPVAQEIALWIVEAGVRSHCFNPALPPFGQKSAAELCTHTISHEPPPLILFYSRPPENWSCFSALSEHKLFHEENSSPVPHTVGSALLLPPCILLPTGDFQHDPSPPGTALCLCGREDEVGEDRVIHCSPQLRACFLYPISTALRSWPLQPW